MPAERSSPQTTWASGSSETTVSTMPSPGSITRGYCTPRPNHVWPSILPLLRAGMESEFGVPAGVQHLHNACDLAAWHVTEKDLAVARGLPHPLLDESEVDVANARTS